MADHDEKDAMGADKFKPVDTSHAIRKEDMNRIRGMQDIQRHGKGATDHGSNPNG